MIRFPLKYFNPKNKSKKCSWPFQKPSSLTSVWIWGDCSKKPLSVLEFSVRGSLEFPGAAPLSGLATHACTVGLPCFSASCCHVVHFVVTRRGHPHHLPLSLWIRHHEWSLLESLPGIFLTGKRAAVIIGPTGRSSNLSHLTQTYKKFPEVSGLWLSSLHGFLCRYKFSLNFVFCSSF